MSEQNPETTGSTKKILESSPMSGIAVPIAIVLVGALIIFGVTKMLSSGKNHRDLVAEMSSKTFGNRWVAAYELSKFLAAQKIPKEDMPWVIENLTAIYRTSIDPRTRNFIVLALGTLDNPLSIPILNDALGDPDHQVKFNAAVSIGNMTHTDGINWEKLEGLLDQENDPGLKQVTLLSMAAHKRPSTQEKAIGLIQNSEKTIRYASAIILIGYKNDVAIPYLEEILNLKYDVAQAGELNGAQAEALKMNVLENIEKYKWSALSNLVEKAQLDDSNVRVSTKAKQVLKVLKN